MAFQNFTMGSDDAVEIHEDDPRNPFYHPSISASWAGEEPWRLERLQRVIGFLAARGVVCKVRHLDDLKGSLTVDWFSPPSSEDVHAVEDAWGSGIGDGCSDLVTHEVDGKYVGGYK